VLFRPGDKVVGKSCRFYGDVWFSFGTLDYFIHPGTGVQHLLGHVEHTDPAVALLSIYYGLNCFFIKKE